jgi:hypothetical protein
VNGPTHTNRLGRGTGLALVQRPARQRTYALGRGDQVVGSLRFPDGRRSPALALGAQQEPAFPSCKDGCT